MPTFEPDAWLSMASVRMAAPRYRKMLVTTTSCQTCQPPVPDMVMGPVTLSPLISRWNRPPAASALATRTAMLYQPAVTTLTM